MIPRTHSHSLATERRRPLFSRIQRKSFYRHTLTQRDERRSAGKREGRSGVAATPAADSLPECLRLLPALAFLSSHSQLYSPSLLVTVALAWITLAQWSWRERLEGSDGSEECKMVGSLGRVVSSLLSLSHSRVLLLLLLLLLVLLVDSSGGEGRGREGARERERRLERERERQQA